MVDLLFVYFRVMNVKLINENNSLIIAVSKRHVQKFQLLKKSLTKLKLIFCGDSRYLAIFISLTARAHHYDLHEIQHQNMII